VLSGKTGLTPEAEAASPSHVLTKSVSIERKPVTWGDFEKAVELYVHGRFEEAAQLLNEIYALKLTARQNRLIRFLNGVIAVKLGRYEAAGKAFSPGVRILQGLEDYALFFQGQILLREGKWKEAQSRLEEYLALRPEPPLLDEARLYRIEALMGQGRTEQAIEMCQELLKSGKTGEIVLILAHLHEAEGRLEEALSGYRLAMEGAFSPQVRAKAFRKYKELLSFAVLKIGSEDFYLDFVRLLRREWRLDDALALINYLQTVGGEPEYLDELAYEKGRVLLFLNRPQEACDHYRQAALTATSEHKGKLSGMHGECLKRLGQWEEAGKVLLSAASLSTTRDQADQNYFEAGALFLRAGREKKAEETWKRVSAGARTRTVADDILWNKAWYYWEKQSWDKAAETFGQLGRRYQGREKGAAGLYWLARTLERMGSQSEAEEQYLSLASASNPFHYYRLLSLERLRTIKADGPWSLNPDISDLRPPKGIKPVSFHEKSSSPGPDLKTERIKLMLLMSVPVFSDDTNRALTRLRSLAAAGALDLAFDEARYVRRLLANQGKRNDSNLSESQKKMKLEEIEKLRCLCFSFMNAYLAETGEYYRLMRFLYNNRDALPPPESELEEAMERRRFYPLPYQTEISASAASFDLDPALILAVIRTESFYNRHAVSYSNALGLMQILPSTGRRIAERLERPDFEPDDLFKPKVNITFGSWYLSSLTREFSGQFVLALAAYNAGPFNVKQWLRQSGEIDLEEFIDRIPFEQARNYVKKNLVYYYLYHLYYSGEMIDYNLRRPLDKNYLELIDF